MIETLLNIIPVAVVKEKYSTSIVKQNKKTIIS